MMAEKIVSLTYIPNGVASIHIDFAHHIVAEETLIMCCLIQRFKVLKINYQL